MGTPGPGFQRSYLLLILIACLDYRVPWFPGPRGVSHLAALFGAPLSALVGLGQNSVVPLHGRPNSLSGLRDDLQ